ncbi:MAG: hypothetical protein H7332_16275 [Bdellovibrionales bacterium]|nr:hypothetical protein [Ramlibacter sp.]
MPKIEDQEADGVPARQIELVNLRINSSNSAPEAPADFAELHAWSPQGEVQAGASGFGVSLHGYAELEGLQPQEFERDAINQFLRAAPPELATEVARLLGSGLSFALMPEDVSARVPHLAGVIDATTRYNLAQRRLHSANQRQACLRRLEPVADGVRIFSSLARIMGGVSGIVLGASSQTSVPLSALERTLVIVGSVTMLGNGIVTFLSRLCSSADSVDEVFEPYQGGSVIRVPAVPLRTAEELQAFAILNLAVSMGDAQAAMSAQRQAAAGPEWTVQVEPLTAVPDAALTPATQLDHELEARWKRLLIDEIGRHKFTVNLARDTARSPTIHGLHRQVKAAAVRALDAMEEVEGRTSDEAAHAMLRLRTSVAYGPLLDYVRSASGLFPLRLS